MKRIQIIYTRGNRHVEAGRRQTGEGKLELEKKQEGDKQAYGELWKIHAKSMEEM